MEIVVDASALLKGYFPDEEGSDKAGEIMFDYSYGKLDLKAPSLIDYEVLNAIMVAFKRNRITLKEVKEVQSKIIRLDIEKFDLRFFKDELFDISKEYDISICASSYLALGMKLERMFVTGDKRLWNTLKEKVKNVIWIEDFSP